MHVILGAGEVGQGLGAVIAKAHQAVAFDDPAKSLAHATAAAVLHICIPWSESFITSVEEAIVRFTPKLTIMHSTVPVGTTRLCGNTVVYSFVRGRHPDLAHMTRYTKHLGGVDQASVEAAQGVLQRLGFHTLIHSNPEVVELGKLWDTTYYGICIAATKLAKAMSDAYGLDYAELSVMNQTYNAEVDQRFRRPELDPTPGPIGGHCVVPNARLLLADFPDQLLLRSIEEAE